MVALIVGVIFVAFTVIAALPSVLGWGPQIILFIQGCLPVLTALCGILAIFIGIADLKDKREAKKEEADAAKAVEEENKTN